MENEYSEVVEEQVVIPNYKQGKKLRLKDFKIFLTKPAEFFNGEIAVGKTLYLIIIAWTLGIAHVINYIEKQTIKYGGVEGLEGNFIGAIMNSWRSYWFFVVVLGIVSGSLIWSISGWWYNLRLKWCALQEIEKFNGRVIYSYNKLITAIPTIVFTIIETFRFLNYEATCLDDRATILTFITIVVLLFTNVYTIINSYRSVIGVFKLKKGLARLWFLILPLILIGFSMGVLVIGILLGKI